MTMLQACLTSLHASFPRRRISRDRRGFTLVELLIVVAIIALLIGLLLPALGQALGATRSFKCKMGLRSVAFDFSVFADDQLHGSRGNDEIDLRRGRFRLETFENSQYGLGEFWSYGSKTLVTLPDPQGRDPMRCAAVKGELTLRKNVPCSEGGVGPWQNVSFGFNVRLHVSDTQAAAGRPAGVQLTSAILQGADGAAPSAIPLAWDVDGAAAASRGSAPVFSGPSLGSTLLYANDAYWYPGLRHNGALNVAFIDGHIAASRAPLREAGWAWGFDPGR